MVEVRTVADARHRAYAPSLIYYQIRILWRQLRPASSLVLFDVPYLSALPVFSLTFPFAHFCCLPHASPSGDTGCTVLRYLYVLVVASNYSVCSAAWGDSPLRPGVSLQSVSFGVSVRIFTSNAMKKLPGLGFLKLGVFCRPALWFGHFM